MAKSKANSLILGAWGPDYKEGSHSSPFLTQDEAPSAGGSAHRCCQTHDHCYTQAKKLKSCKFLIDNPYTNTYSFKCSGNEITCSDKNNDCEAFICNCDRQAAICFSKAPYNKENKDLDTKERC
ncbi:phospholipase A2 isoform X3 [Grammomys surdaster]|uniref:phospholipase A2 isoform X3 n=1 Tax=Grammomys surdaster TaxID=491861 RepID=UPI0010A01A8B|nr:phospholipase A2 isoform X3 [Grammomys surdaster]